MKTQRVMGLLLVFWREGLRFLCVIASVDLLVGQAGAFVAGSLVAVLAGGESRRVAIPGRVPDCRGRSVLSLNRSLPPCTWTRLMRASPRLSSSWSRSSGVSATCAGCSLERAAGFPSLRSLMGAARDPSWRLPQDGR